PRSPRLPGPFRRGRLRRTQPASTLALEAGAALGEHLVGRNPRCVALDAADDLLCPRLHEIRSRRLVLQALEKCLRELRALLARKLQELFEMLLGVGHGSSLPPGGPEREASPAAPICPAPDA